jgi:FtsP/CotA-like multicopper oxidase with cupredoxin domain
MRLGLVAAILLLTFQGWSASVSVRLAIESGTLAFIDGQSVPYKIFTQNTSVFGKNSDLLIWNTGDVITLKVVNVDIVPHGFTIDGLVNYGSIAPTDSIEQTFTLSTAGVHRYFDPLNDPYNQYTGLAGIVHVKDPADLTSYFYWDLREHQVDWFNDILAGNSPLINQYDPKYFTINGNSEPDINLDAVARVIGSVGQELRVVIVNNGMSIHSMHFHGYQKMLPMKEERRIRFLSIQKKLLSFRLHLIKRGNTLFMTTISLPLQAEASIMPVCLQP